MENRDNFGNASNSIILLLIIIVAAVGVYILFIKDKDVNQENVPVQEVEKIDNVKRINLINKVSGISGDLYIDRDGKAYFVLSNSANYGNLSSLTQDFYVEKSDIYSYDVIKAILLSIPGVVTINYDELNGQFSLTTNDKTYVINDNDIGSSRRIYIVEYDDSKPIDNAGTTDKDNTNDSSDDKNNDGSNKPDDSTDNSGGTTDDTGKIGSKEDIIKKKGQQN